MSTQRPTKTVTLPATKAEATIYTYITGGEKHSITKIITSGISADITGTAKGDIPLSLVFEANQKALELLVVSISGFDGTVSDLPSRDYDFLVSEINKVTADNDFLG